MIDPNAPEGFKKYFNPENNLAYNKLEITDPKELSKIETEIYDQQNSDRPEFKEFTIEELQEVHKHQFGKIYEWAGELRTYTTDRGKAAFEEPYNIKPKLEELSENLKQDNHLKGLSQDEFSDKAAHYMSELNAIHPFIEGNGRISREFLSDLADQAGHKIDLTQIENNKKEWYEASKKAFDSRHDSLYGLDEHDTSYLSELIKNSLIEKTKIKKIEEKILYSTEEELFQDDDEQLNRVALILMMAKQGTSDKSLEYSKEVDKALRKQLNEMNKKGEEIPLPNIQKEQQQDDLER